MTSESGFLQLSAFDRQYKVKYIAVWSSACKHTFDLLTNFNMIIKVWNFENCNHSSSFSLASDAEEEGQWLVLIIFINILKCHSCPLWRGLLLGFIFEPVFFRKVACPNTTVLELLLMFQLYTPQIPVETCILSFWPVNGKLHLFSEPSIIQCGQLFLKCSFSPVLKVLSFLWTACCYTPISLSKGKVCVQYHTRVVPADQVSHIEVLFPCSRNKKKVYQLSQAIAMTDNYPSGPPFQWGWSFTVRCRVLCERLNEGQWTNI